MKNSAENGVEFLRVPDTYYEMLPDRIGKMIEAGEPGLTHARALDGKRIPLSSVTLHHSPILQRPPAAMPRLRLHRRDPPMPTRPRGAQNGVSPIFYFTDPNNIFGPDDDPVSALYE